MVEQEKPYESIKGQLILRDHLAADRTILANGEHSLLISARL